jgi:hypothetical protein
MIISESSFLNEKNIYKHFRASSREKALAQYNANPFYQSGVMVSFV